MKAGLEIASPIGWRVRNKDISIRLGRRCRLKLHPYERLGIGMASIRSDKNSSNDSFGLISLCSIGPILSVMLLGIIMPDLDASYTPVSVPELGTTRDAAHMFAKELPAYVSEVAIALLPVIVIFGLFQLVFRRFRRHQLGKILVGLLYTYVGLVLFLVGVNVGFMPAGATIGATIAAGGAKWLLIPIGALVGYFIVRAEPAVQVLARQVEEISNGSITQKALNYAMSIGIALSVGLAMVRILTGLNIMWILIPGYALSLGMTFFVPQIFTGCLLYTSDTALSPARPWVRPQPGPHSPWACTKAPGPSAPSAPPMPSPPRPGPHRPAQAWSQDVPPPLSAGHS